VSTDIDNATEATVLALESHLAAAHSANLALAKQVERLRAEVDVACAMFSRYEWKGSLSMPREFHVERGRRMAGLPQGAR
jgi:uncharacterized protein involved in tolerance to divalent cations